MKKISFLFITLVMLITMSSFTTAENHVNPQIEGVIAEVLEDGSILVDSINAGPVLVHVNEDTVLEGFEKLAVGQYVYVTYNGVMTRSLPPQITAQKIECHMINGKVTSADEAMGTILMESKDHGLVLVHLPDMDMMPVQGDYVTVYYGGIMALSYPGQVGGVKVDIYQMVDGLIKEVGDGYFLLEGENGIIHVNTSDESRIGDGVEVGVMVEVLYHGAITKSLPPQVFGMFVNRLSGDI